MSLQPVAVLELTAAEKATANVRKRSEKSLWTHKVCCGEYETFLTVGPRPDLAQRVVDLWPESFSGVVEDVPERARPVAEANRRYLISLEERLGDPHAKRRKAIAAELADSLRPRSFWDRLLGR